MIEQFNPIHDRHPFHFLDRFVIPVLCLLNGHIQSQPECGLRPFRCHPRGDYDLKLQEIRKADIKKVRVEIEDELIPACIPKDPAEMERYEAYLQKYSVADTLLDTPLIMDIGPDEKDPDGYKFSKLQFYIQKDGATDPRHDILVGPTFKDSRPEALAAPAMAPAAAPPKKPEEESDHESSGVDSDEEVKDPPSKEKRTKKKAPRKSAVTTGER